METITDEPVHGDVVEYFVDMGSWSVYAKSNTDAYDKAKAIIDKCTKAVMDSGVDVEGYEPVISGVEKA